MGKLNVNICGVDFKNPLIAASGTYGFGQNYTDLYPLELLGGVSLKGTTLEPRDGNPSPRVAETPMGMLNSVGLQNPGIHAFIGDELPEIEDVDVVKIANIAGATVRDCCEVAWLLDYTCIDMIELNISCPNVKAGGVAFGVNPELARDITYNVKNHTKKPLIVKLSPNVTDITEIAKAVADGGADAVSLINTVLGMRIDTKTKRPILHQNVGGLSGPAIFPIAVRMVWQVSNAVDIPIIGLGGISSANDVIEMMMAGASTVQIGAELFRNPMAPVKILEDLNNYIDSNNLSNISEITKSVIPY